MTTAPKTEMVHVRVPKKTKKQAEAALEEMGISMSTVVRYVINFVARRKALPFRIEVPSAETQAAMEEARRGGLPSVDNVSDLLAELNAPD